MATTLKLSLALTMSPSSPRIPIEITSTTTAKELFDIVVESSKIPPSALKIIYRGKIITKNDDVESVSTKFKLEDGSVIHCMGKPVENAHSATTSATPASTSTSPPSMSVPVAASTTSVSAIAPPAATGVSGAATTLVDDLHKLQHEGCQNNLETYCTALKTLGKILDNIANNPQEEKYRQLKLANAAFQKRLGSLQGSEAVLMKCGFVKTPEVYKLEPSAEKWNLLQAARAVVQGEITRVTAQQQTTSTRPMPASTTGGMGGGLGSAEMNALAGMMGGGTGGGAGLGGMPPLPPGMDMNRMQQMLSDPNAISSVLSNPMIQQMVENDPRFANNPQVRQALQAIRSNPGMVDQMSRMMSDPAMRQQMQSLQGVMGGGGPGGAVGGSGTSPSVGAGGPGQQQQPPSINMETMQQAMAIARMAQQQGGSGAPPAGGGSNPSGGVGGTTGANNGGTDDEMTEEEMIRQAIERSLREQ